MRLGLFGGTFDPPHRGHLALAQAAADVFRLDRVLWAPAGRQPLKAGEPVSPYAERLAMVRLACWQDPRFSASDVDAPRADGQPNYTAHTLAMLSAEFPEATLFCLAGADSFAQLGSWREPRRLLSLAEWIVLSRPGYRLEAPRGLELSEADRARIHLLPVLHEDVSATELRERLHDGDPCAELLSAGVAEYLARHPLYGREPRQVSDGLPAGE